MRTAQGEKHRQMILNDLRALQGEARYSIFSGGTRSGKTWAHLEALIAYAATHRKKLISVVSVTYPHLLRGAIRDFRAIMEAMRVGDKVFFDRKDWHDTRMIYTFSSGSVIEFFSADNVGKVHGPQRDILFLNEAQNINHEIARHLFVRTKSTVLIDFNPTHRFWVHDLKDNPGVLWVDSTYRDNLQLSPGQIAEIESGKSNPRWWRVYGEGQIGQLEGLIYPDFIEIDEFPEDVEYVYGVDFGFSIDPTAVVKVGRNSEGWFVDEILYRTRVHTAELAEILPRGVPVYCDSAEPKTIEELVALGVSARKADKQVAAGISHVQSQRIHITRRSKNTIRELRSYAFDVDLYGNYTGVPAPRQSDHAMDAMRYAIFTHYRNKLNSKLFAPKPQRIYR